MLLVIVNVRFANEISMDWLLSDYETLNTKNMIYNMFEFHISYTYIGPRFINLNICCGFLKKCGNKTPNSYVKTYG